MATTMMRVRQEIHDCLRQIAESEGVTMQDVLDRALEEYRRNRLFEKADAAYEALQADPELWSQELQERAAFNNTGAF